MARVGGRNAWWAWFGGLLALAVVGALVWLAAPMAPVLTEWAGQVLRGELAGPRTEREPPPAEPAPEQSAAPVAPTPTEPFVLPQTCEQLYPPPLWERLQESEDISLDESVPFAPSAVPALPEMLGATTLVGCAWTDAVGRSVATVAQVSEQASAEAARVLTETGFTCADEGGGVRCERAAAEGADAETHIVREGLWLASIRSYPGPPFELSGTVARVWPG